MVVPTGGTAPAPCMVPPLQVEAPEAVTVSEPPRIPADWVSVVTLIGSPLLKLMVPPLVMARVVPTLVTVEAALKLTVQAGQERFVCPLTLYEPLMSIVPLTPNETVGPATDDPALSVLAPPKRSVVPADPVKAPVLAPPPSRPNVPPDTVMSTRLALFIVARREVTPVPAVLRTVPLLKKFVAPPALRFRTWLFWMSQVPVLVITQVKPPPQVAISPVPVQVVVPLVSRWRPPKMLLTTLPLMAS